ncbi:MAG: HAD family hydrolase [Acidobacteriota bacterium]|nr:HAD family hydrolase [Acidobacteriota bacterium]
MENGKRRRAVFLDRDGTIAEEMGYLNHLSRFQLFPFAAAAIRRLNEAAWPVIVVTNQSGVTRGFFPEELIHQVHDRMVAELAAGGARLDGIYYCPHHSGHACDCRKPKPGLLERAAREHSLAIEGSFVVSDRYADVQMGQTAGCSGILVLTGYGRGEYDWNRQSWPRQPDSVVEDLTAAVDLILRRQ